MGTLTFSPSLYIGMAYFVFESTFRISVFLGFSETMAILGVGRFKWILCCPLFISFLFFFFGGGGRGLFNVKFKLFFIVFFCNFKYLFEKVKISLIGGGGGGGGGRG